MASFVHARLLCAANDRNKLGIKITGVNQRGITDKTTWLIIGTSAPILQPYTRDGTSQSQSADMKYNGQDQQNFQD